MRVFVTGATGFIGSAVVAELLDAGHRVVGLARSDHGAAALTAAGAQVHRGDLDDVESLRAGAAGADGVIHTAFVHDFSDYAGAARTDRRAIAALGETLEGSGRPFVVTSGIAGVGPGRVVTEDDPAAPESPRGSEEALAYADRGVRVSAVRLAPTVHGEGDHGFVPRLIEIARAQGVAAHPGDGTNRWSAVHRLDAARLFRLALEEAPAGARLHGVAEEGVPVREIAEAIGRRTGLPVASAPADHFGWLGPFFALDLPASSDMTRKRLGWHPEHPELRQDLNAGHYFAPAGRRSPTGS
ncbi:SDR family oxidoreductase [Streptomyces sp. NPDC003635]